MLRSRNTLSLFLLFQGGPWCCLKADCLFLSHPFSKTDPLRPTAATNLGAAVIPTDSTATEQAAQRAHQRCGSSPPEDCGIGQSHRSWIQPWITHCFCLKTGQRGTPDPPRLSPPASSLATSVVWELQTNPPNWRKTAFFLGNQCVSAFLPTVFPPSLLPLNPDLSLLWNLATSRPIPWSLSSNRAPTSWLFQKISFYFSFFLFQFACGDRHLFSQRGEWGGKDGQLSLEQSLRV